MEYAKSFVLYSILHELSKTLGAEVTDGWSEQLTPICVDGDMFAVHISDDAFRADFAARYAASVDEVQKLLHPSCTLSMARVRSDNPPAGRTS